VSLEAGDLVVVVGATVTSDGSTERHRILANVVDVGKADVFVREEGFNGRTFKISAERCAKVEEIVANPLAKVLTPRLGDLVMSVSERLGKVERKMGVLVEISDMPGRSRMARLLQGEKTEVAAFDSLIVLE